MQLATRILLIDNLALERSSLRWGSTQLDMVKSLESTFFPRLFFCYNHPRKDSSRRKAQYGHKLSGKTADSYESLYDPEEPVVTTILLLSLAFR